MTAVKKLINHITPYLTNKLLNFFSLVFILAMTEEKQQIKDAYNQGYRDGLEDYDYLEVSVKDVSEFSNAEDYYNQTFNDKKK